MMSLTTVPAKPSRVLRDGAEALLPMALADLPQIGSSTRSVEQFPVRNQMTLGGPARKTLRS